MIEKDLVHFWIPQPIFQLVEGFTYKPDFLVYTGYEIYAEDVKGVITQRFRDSRRMWETYGMINLHIIRLDGDSWSKEIVVPNEA